ncbi:MAG: AAA family ATPase [Lachnospiraceae bacterium]|nr:AAA family ATPase [Lachnospiraceae bacterium]
MGKHYNPGNEAFAEILRGDYVDKTGMIGLINQVINTPDKLICVSRPRRFGKSFAASMIGAYYDRSCDSHSLFQGYQISKLPGYEEHINQYNVISADITGFISKVKKENGNLRDVPGMISNELLNDLIRNEPALAYLRTADPKPDLGDCLLSCVKETGKKFIFIIDEWDALIREGKNDPEVQEAYLNFLRGLFKNRDITPYAIAAAYITGILPVKKDGSQSAVSDFREYSMTDPGDFAPYVGFSEADVKDICQKYAGDFEMMQKWYNGYTVGNERSVYNPYSVFSAIKNKGYRSYWRKTSAAEALLTYVDMDQDGLQEEIAHLISGESISIDTGSFQNDVETFSCKDDVLTLLVHLGYLSFDSHYDNAYAEYEKRIVRIPNEEVRIEFDHMLRKATHEKLRELVRTSDQLLADTLAGQEDRVASAIDNISRTNYAPTYANGEQALRYLIKFAYISCVDQYMRIEELPSGHGIADVVFLPNRGSSLPAMIIELKWDRSEEAAIRQIKGKDYPAVLNTYGGEIVLAGINYSTKTKEYTCKIERICR